MKLSPYITVFSFLFTVSIYFSCGQTNVQDVGDIAEIQSKIDSDLIVVTDKQFQSSGFAMGQMEKRFFDQTIRATGSIEVPEKNRAIVSSHVGGTVGPVDLIIGQWVSKHQKLFTLTNPDLIDWQQELLEVQSNIAFLREENERQKLLSKDNITAKKDYLKAEANLRMAEAKLAALSEKLMLIGIPPSSVSASHLTSSLDIVAPINGYVEDIKVVRGSYLSAAMPAIEILNTNHMHVELNVLESHLTKLKKEQNVEFRVQSAPTKAYKGSIHLINTMLDENHYINIHCHIDDQHKNELMPGMYIDAQIYVENQEFWALPQEAIVNIDDDHYALISKSYDKGEHTFEKVKILTGATQNGWTEVLNAMDLKLDQSFLIKGAYNVVLE